MNTKTNVISSRQLAFFAAFVLPAGKLLELPSLLTRYVGGDLLIAAFIGFAAEFLAFCSLLFFAKRSGSAPVEYLERRCGKLTARIFCGVYALFLLACAVLPVFDLEKFSHAAFSDTSPTFFIFTPFLFLSGFICTKGLKGVGRSADIAPLLFFFPLLGLFVFSVGQADFSRLLPVIEKPFTTSLSAAWKTLPYFASGGLCLPVFEGYRYRQGDEKKLLPAYAVGAFLSLLFFAVFFALFGQLGEKEHYAIMKIGQFFPALKFIGRIDLLLVYVFTVGLFYYTALPLQLFTENFTRCFHLKSKLFTAATLSIALYFCVLYLNKYYLSLHQFFARYMPPIFLVFSLLLPMFFGMLGIQNNRGRYALKAQKIENIGGKTCKTNER
jgi:hypothetical protein